MRMQYFLLKGNNVNNNSLLDSALPHNFPDRAFATGEKVVEYFTF